MTIIENENDTNKKNSNKYIGTSVVWAAMMIASALVIKDQKDAAVMLFLLIGGWAATVSQTGGFKQAMACERAMFRKLLGKDNSTH